MADEETWTVSKWLKSFGFERYLGLFVENGYETKKLCSNLKPEDLDEMDISDIPHRTILFNQSDMLRTGLDRPSSSTSHTNGSIDKPPSPAASPSSLASSDLNSETYSTVFDDITTSKPKTAPVLRSIAKKKSATVDRSESEKGNKNYHKTKRSISTGVLKLHSSSTGPPKTKLELKLVLRELVNRDGLALNEPPYCNENGSANISLLAGLAEQYADEMNIESLTIMDALEDVWRYKVNENSDLVIPKTGKLTNATSISSNPDSATSAGSFVFLDQGTYSEPFDSRSVITKPVKPMQQSISPRNQSTVPSLGALKSSTSNGLEDSSYLDPFDAIDGTHPVIVKTSPSTDNKKKPPIITPKPTAFKNTFDHSRDSKKTLYAPESPSLSIHSSSSDDIEKSPKIKKSWAPFRRSGKSPDVPKRKLNKRLSGSMEALDERLISYQSDRNRISRQSLPPSEAGITGLPRSISSNPALLYQSSLIEDFKSSKKKFGGSQGAMHQYSPKTSSSIANEFHKASSGPPPSPSTKSRVKALTLEGNKSSELELSTVLEVYVDGKKEPVFFHKAQTLEVSKQAEKKHKGGIISRLFKKKDKKTESKIDECSSEESDDQTDSHDRERGLTVSHSLPNIASVSQAKVHSEYTELFDIPNAKQKTEIQPPKLPSRTKIQQIPSTPPSSSPRTSPPAHHRLMIKSDSTSSSEIIQSLPSSGDDVIEIRVPTPSDATYNEPWTHIPYARNISSKYSPNTGTRGSGSSSGSPRKGSLTMVSPVKRRKLFSEGGGHSPTSKTLPRASLTNEPVSFSARTARRSLTPDDTLFDDSISPKHSPKPFTRPRSRCLSNENVSMRDFMLSNTFEPPLKPRNKLVHTQSSPNYYKRSDVIKQLKRTGVSFESKDIYSPPVSPEHLYADISVKQTTEATTKDEKEMTTEEIVEISIRQTKFRKSTRTHTHIRSLLENLVENLLREEGIDFTETPYSNHKGDYGIPTALVSRYATDTHASEEAIVKAFDSVRRTQLVQKRRGHIPLKKDWRKFSDINTDSLEDFLVSIGLPQYYEVLMQEGIINITTLKSASNAKLNSLPLNKGHKKQLCAFVKLF